MKPRGVKNDLRELTRLQFHLDRGGLRIENEESPHGRQHQLALTPPRLLTSRFLDATLLLWITVLDSKHVSPSCSSFVIATSHLAPTPTLLLLLLRQPIARRRCCRAERSAPSPAPTSQRPLAPTSSKITGSGTNGGTYGGRCVGSVAKSMPWKNGWL